MSTWTARIVELDGTPVQTLVDCNIPRYAPGLTEDYGSATITLPKHETGSAIGQHAALTVPGREVQILRDGSVVWWGVPCRRTTSSSDRGSVTYELNGIGWYFTRRFIDAPLTNLLGNGDFEDGMTDWSTSGGDITDSIATDIFRRGTQALRLVSGTTFGENYAYTFETVNGGDIGELITVAAYAYIEDWTGPAFEGRGLYVEQIIPGGSTVTTHNSTEGVIDDDTGTATDAWMRFEATTWVPPGLDRDVLIRLYAPNGSIVWDSVEMVKMSSLAVGKTPEDIAVTASRIVEFIQDPTYSKSDLSIPVMGTPPTTGKTFVFPKAWQFTDHTPADRALNEEIAPLGLDWDIQVSDKAFTLYSPRKCVDRGGTPDSGVSTVTLSLSTNVAEYALDEDGQQIYNDVTFLGDGDGPDREEGRAVDTSATDGLVLQSVESAPSGTTIDALDDLAAEKLARTKQLVRVLTVKTVQYTDLIGTLLRGDVVDVNIVDGVDSLTGDWRIVGLEVTPRDETLSLTLNPE